MSRIPFTMMLLTGLIIAACSTDTAPTTTSETGSSDATIQTMKRIDQTTPLAMVFDPETGTLSQKSLTLRKGDVVAVIIKGDGKRDLSDYQRVQLGGATEMHASVRSSSSERIRSNPHYYDATGDGVVDRVLHFSANDMAPPILAYGFKVEINGFVEDRTIDYELRWMDTGLSEWKSEFPTADAVVRYNIAKKSFNPISVVMPKDGEVAIVLYDGHAGYGTACQHDLTKASLLGASELHVGFYEKGNQAAGAFDYVQSTHFMDYSDDDCMDRVVHFSAKDFTSNIGQFTVEITGGAAATSFGARAQQGKAQGTISLIFAANP